MRLRNGCVLALLGLMLLYASPALALSNSMLAAVNAGPRYTLPDGTQLSRGAVGEHLADEGYDLVDGDTIGPGECAAATVDDLEQDEDRTNATVAFVCHSEDGNSTVIFTVAYASFNEDSLTVGFGEIQIVNDRGFLQETYKVRGPSLEYCAQSGSDFCYGFSADIGSFEYELVGERGNGVSFGLGGKGTFLISHDATCIGWIFFVCAKY